MTEEGKANIQVEKGKVSPEQMEEIEAGEYFTIKQIANKLRYSKPYITKLVQRGRIKAVKPLGTGWRIAKSEYERLTTEGIPPLPREKPEAKIREIEVEPEKMKKIAPEPKGKEEKKREPFRFPLDFSGLFK